MTSYLIRIIVIVIVITYGIIISSRLMADRTGQDRTGGIGKPKEASFNNWQWVVCWLSFYLSWKCCR